VSCPTTTRGSLIKRIAFALEADPYRSLSKFARELRLSRRTIQNAVNLVTRKKFRDLREKL
jgi:transcriptional antiterminator